MLDDYRLQLLGGTVRARCPIQAKHTATGSDQTHYPADMHKHGARNFKA